MRETLAREGCNIDLLRFLRYWGLLALVGLVGCGTGNDSDQVGPPSALPPSPRPTTTTVMVYMCGSDLESANRAATRNLQQILSARYPDQARFVFCTGGADLQDPLAPVTSWRTVKRHLLQPGHLQEVADLGSISMADPQTLKDFLGWGMAQYPADRYWVVIWDHGFGYQGVAFDENNPGPFLNGRMSQPALLQALQQSASQQGARFDLVGFDCCLMGAAEISSGLAPFSNYLLASEANEPNTGWNWRPLVQALAEDGQISAPELGRLVCDGYIAQFRPSTGQTLAVLDLSQDAALQQSVGQLAGALNRGFSAPSPRTIQDLMVSRTETYQVENLAVDLGDFCDRLVANSVEPQLAVQVRQALDREVVYAVQGDTARTHGLSLFFPDAASVARLPDAQHSYSLTAYLGEYLRLVANAYQWASQQTTQISLSSLRLDSATGTFSGILTSALGVSRLKVVVSLDPPGSSTVRYLDVLLTDQNPRRTLAPLPVSAELTTRSLQWNGHLVVAQPEPEDSQPQKDILLLPARINGDQQTIKILQDSSGPNPVFTVLGTTNSILDDSGFRDEPVLDTDVIQPLVAQFDRSTGTESLVPFGPSFSAGAQQVLEAGLPANTYFVYFLVRDLRGGSKLSSDNISWSVP